MHSFLSILYLGSSSPNRVNSSTGRMLDGWLAGMGLDVWVMTAGRPCIRMYIFVYGNTGGQ